MPRGDLEAEDAAGEQHAPLAGADRNDLDGGAFDGRPVRGEDDVLAVRQNLRPPVAQLALRRVRTREHALVAPALTHDPETGVVGPGVTSRPSLPQLPPAQSATARSIAGPPSTGTFLSFPCRAEAIHRPSGETNGRLFPVPCSPWPAPAITSVRIWSNARRKISSRRPTMAVTKSCRPSALNRTMGVKEGCTPGSSSTSNRMGPAGGRALRPFRRPTQATASSRTADNAQGIADRVGAAESLRLRVPLDATAPVNASANCATVCQRSAGSFSSARATAASMWWGTVLRSSTSGRGSSDRTWAKIAWAEGPVNSGRPVSISYSTTPRAYTSVRGSCFCSPAACSGLMYSGVPRLAPAFVIRVLPSPHQASAMPKSATSARPSWNSTLSGLMSR